MTGPAPAAQPPAAGPPPAGRFVYECALRWSDMDAYGHVNNARFLTLYEEARVALMFVAGADGRSAFADGVVIARHEIDYVRPVGYRIGPDRPDGAPTVRIEMWVQDLRPSRFIIGYELFDGDALAGRARTVLVPYDLREGRPRRLTEDEDGLLRPYLAP